ncbi:hypothetical protein EPUS_04942 [Endocarpon pusillum Z07020]|uniref:Uncharacterized protein n=1 Tax=Endocarpon pusillum (strain Z07020 / HMAS-L-300199) TaxID=1263415 RepID=U1GR00_ENDPU|nr:uncharacterized protein EPUS_04942 [Endocarpon pusillum Z07020]ERF74773.1 hypothetical protein EPUS_04942 [Endocarpon pusillum Z07020]
MARLQNVEVRGFKSIPNDIVVVELPATLKKLHLKWESSMGFGPSTPDGPLNDDQIRRCIERNRQDFEKVVTKLFEKAPDLQIFFDTVVGHAPLNKTSAMTARYAIIRVNVVKGQDGEMWSWGGIERKVDRLMVEEG